LHIESLSLTLLDCLIFGSTLSATDPVTILAIFNTYKVDPQLYSIIFGESILNDAVSIVMFDVLSTFRGKAISIVSLFHGFGLFAYVFSLSMALGVAFGLSCSLMLKHSRLSAYPPLESCLVTLVAYTSYFFSNGVYKSGIVSLLFCGITLKHYAYHNMSRHTQRATRYIFQTLANLSENFIFIYLGLSLFTQDKLVYKPLFIIVTVAAVVLSRYSAVFPIAAVVNSVKRARLRRRAKRGGSGSLREGSATGEEELPREWQVMLFWAGLRGAVGFALSAGIEGHNAAALQTTVLVAVVLTVIVFGGTTAQMLDILGIRTGVEDDEGDSTDEEEEAEIAALRLKSVRRRKKMVSGHMATNSETRSLYRDEEADPPRQSNTWPTKNPYPDENHFADTNSSSGSSTEVLPSQGIYPNDGSTSVPRRSKDFDTEEDGSVKKFLDRAGLIMRDGRWFSTLDQRYLTPMFTNSVASRKHEERKAMRRSEVALAAAEGSGGVNRKVSASGGSSRNSGQFDRSLGTFDERDADILDEEDDDDGSLVRSLDGSSASLTGVSTSGTIRRTNSRTASDEESKGKSMNNSSASTASRMTGAFAPFSADPPRSARSNNGESKHRTSDDLGPL
jgi:sodium/hydrogen exchanger-like protein 6/7